MEGWLAELTYVIGYLYRVYCTSYEHPVAVAGPPFWNTLPAELRQPDMKLVTFQRLLKTICLSVTQAHSDFWFNRAM